MTKEEAYKRIDAFFEKGELRSELDHSLLYELVDEIFEGCERKRFAVGVKFADGTTIKNWTAKDWEAIQQKLMEQ